MRRGEMTARKDSQSCAEVRKGAFEKGRNMGDICALSRASSAAQTLRRLASASPGLMAALMLADRFIEPRRALLAVEGARL